MTHLEVLTAFGSLLSAVAFLVTVDPVHPVITMYSLPEEVDRV